MIAGYLENIKKDEIRLYPEAIQKGLEFLLTTNLEKLSVGTHKINEDRIFAMVSSYMTEPVSARRLERHDRYVDIQCVVSGSEMIGACGIDQTGEIDENRLEANDVIFYKGSTNEFYTTLTAGMFAVYFPWDAHRPNCTCGDNPVQVKKIVIKVAVDLLMKK